MQYENFKHKECKFLDQFEFSWGIHGSETFSKFLPKTTKVINSQLDHAFTMTKRQFANKKQKIDTTDFRNAIVFYLKEIHGICDYAFKKPQINDIFNGRRDQKLYLKNVMCCPEKTTYEDYTKFSELLYDSEKAHVCILAMETKR